MPVTAIDTTVGGASANSYCSMAVAEQFHFDRPPVSTTWSDASIEEKARVLIWATRLIDTTYRWNGVVVDDIQALLWPRHGMIFPNGYAVPSTIIPVQLQHAVAEYGRQLLVADRAEDSDIETSGITKIEAGPVTIDFSKGVVAKVVPDSVFYLIPREWGDVHARVSPIRVLKRA